MIADHFPFNTSFILSRYQAMTEENCLEFPPCFIYKLMIILQGDFGSINYIIEASFLIIINYLKRGKSSQKGYFLKLKDLVWL